MKHAIVIPVLLFSFLSAAAQQQPKTMLEIVKEKTVKKADAFNNSSLALKKQTRMLYANFLGNGLNGCRIYELPLDNMPCLVTDKSETALIPNGVPFNKTDNTIPNARPVQSIMPSKLSLKPIAMPKRPLLKHQRFSR